MHNNSSVNFNVCTALYYLYCTSNLGTFPDKIVTLGWKNNREGTQISGRK